MIFDNAYGRVYEDDDFLFSYYECGIKPSMSENEKKTLVEERKSIIQHNDDEEAFQRGNFF